MGQVYHSFVLAVSSTSCELHAVDSLVMVENEDVVLIKGDCVLLSISVYSKLPPKKLLHY